MVVLPYRSATQSGVTHVAYALGVPVITTDVGGLAETVTPGETGLVSPPEDPAALAEAIVRYFEEGLGPRTARRGREACATRALVGRARARDARPGRCARARPGLARRGMGAVAR